MGRVDNKCALITGAGSGSGRAFAILLAQEGAKVAVSDIDEKGVNETSEMINAEIPGAAIAYGLDVTDEDGWQEVLEEANSAMGGLHILINNAGIPGRGDVEKIDFGVFLGCKYAIPHMEKSGGGSIVNISSVAGLIAGHNLAAYNSAKAAVRHFSKSVALHCAKQGYDIRCNSVLPAFIRTPILQAHFDRFGAEEAEAKLARQVPLGRIGEKDDVAYAVLYLASDESRFLTGTELVIDGGISAM